jgi:ABC-type nitrate/sulfonate/bicarbonate transport system permease component
MSFVDRSSAITTAAAPEHRVRHGLLRAALTLVGLLALLYVLWIGFLWFFDVNSFFGKSPSQVWEWLQDPGAGAERRAELLDAFWFTAKESTLGYLVGTVVAMAVASLFVLSSALERAVMPIALALRSVPIVALIPLLAYIFGRGAMGSMVIITIIVWFPTLVLVTSGLRSVSAQSIDLMAAYDASPLTTLWKVRMPSAVPALFASAKIGVPLAVLGSLLNGWLSSGTGLGSLMVLSTTSSQYSRLWAAVALVTVSSVLVVAVIDAFESIAVGRYAPDRAAR